MSQEAGGWRGRQDLRCCCVSLVPPPFSLLLLTQEGGVGITALLHRSPPSQHLRYGHFSFLLTSGRRFSQRIGVLPLADLTPVVTLTYKSSWRWWIYKMTDFLNIIHRIILYLKRRFEYWTLSPSSGKKFIQLVPISRAYPYLRAHKPNTIETIGRSFILTPCGR